MTVEEAIKVLEDICSETHPAFGKASDRHIALQMAIAKLKESQT